MLTQDDKVMHLPMLDFHCRASSDNDALVVAVLKELGLQGYVAKSGRSYHYYGRRLMSEQDLITMLGRALLYSPIIDRAWIAHQLLERSCGLRISPGKDYKNCPEFFCEI